MDKSFNKTSNTGIVVGKDQELTQESPPDDHRLQYETSQRCRIRSRSHQRQEKVQVHHGPPQRHPSGKRAKERKSPNQEAKRR